MRKSTKTAAASQLILDGRKLLGAVARKGGRILALDRNGRRLGLFDTNPKAMHAILSLPRPNDRGTA